MRPLVFLKNFTMLLVQLSYQQKVLGDPSKSAKCNFSFSFGFCFQESGQNALTVPTNVQDRNADISVFNCNSNPAPKQTKTPTLLIGPICCKLDIVNRFTNQLDQNIKNTTKTYPRIKAGASMSISVPDVKRFCQAASLTP